MYKIVGISYKPNVVAGIELEPKNDLLSVILINPVATNSLTRKDLDNPDFYYNYNDTLEIKRLQDSNKLEIKSGYLEEPSTVKTTTVDKDDFKQLLTDWDKSDTKQEYKRYFNEWLKNHKKAKP